MRTLMDWLVSNSRFRWIFRGVMALTIALMGWLYYGMEQMRPEFEARRTQLQQMFTLEHEVYLLEMVTRDSILQASRDSAQHRMVKDWMGFAQWTEAQRAKARKRNLDMDWKVEELPLVANTEGRVHRLPVNMKILPWNRRFEDLLQYVQDVTSDSTQAWSIDELHVTGDGAGLEDSQILFNGWMLR